MGSLGIKWFGLIGLTLVGLLTVGCQQSDDPAVVSQREKYLLSEEPAGAVGVVAAREQVSAGTTPVVLIGQIGTDAATTWEPGKAAFVITDPPPEGSTDEHHGESGHDADNCPFCKAKAKAKTDSTALVRIVDEQGQVVPFDARKLFSIRESQTVVVRGSASIDDLGNLVVAANGLYPKP